MPPQTMFEKIWDNHVVLSEEGRQTMLYIDPEELRSPMNQLREMGIGTLPQTLREALDALAADPLFRNQLGVDVIREFISIKEMEWIECQRHISDWEIARYLEYY